MKLNINPISQNQVFSAYRINQSAAAKSGKSAGEAAEEARRDLALISPQGKQGSLLESLMKQKMSIMEQKDSLISSAKKDGRSMDSIKSQLESFEKQLKDIDQQISEAMTKEMEKQAEKGKKNDEPKTKQEIENRRMANMLELSRGLEQAEITDSVKTKVDGEARVLKSEIALDKMHRDGISGDYISKKEMKLAEMERKSAELTAEVGEIAAETVKKAAEEGEAAAHRTTVEPEEDEEKRNQDKNYEYQS